MMNTLHFLKSRMSRLLRDRGGNFAMMTAILLPVTIGAASLAIDISDAVLSQRQLQEASDAAALATAAALADGKIDTAGATAFAKDFVAGQMANYIGDTAALKNATTATATKTTSGTTTSYNVSVSSSYSMQLSGLAQVAGFKTTNIGAASNTASGNSQTQGSVSMYLALDKSGSMGDDTKTSHTYTCGHNNNKTCTDYYTKIEALKIAAANLFAQLDSADPSHIYVRTGAVSYDIVEYTASQLNWGTSSVASYVNALEAGGGTNSSGAMNTAYTSLTAKNNAGNDAEDAIHQAKTKQTPKKYIVFMTDGDNNNDKNGGRSYDTLTKATCNEAKAKGIEIYTIAFMAPTGGQALLHYCATDDSHYFQAEKMEDLLAAFKQIGAKASNQITRLTN
jgi:Flp pilus assembly protein TadG